MTNTCRNCKFWNLDKEVGMYDEQTGLCIMLTGNKEWVFGKDGESLANEIFTAPGFGCRFHKFPEND